MSLSNALFTGLSGLDANQTRLNVIGNNIANSNTVKSSRKELKTEDFIKMMITQLQNQDPMEPAKNQELLAQMSQIGQLQSSTQLQETLKSFSAQSQISSAGSMIGKAVEGNDENNDQVTGIVAGACGNPAVLAFSNNLTPTHRPNVAYAMIFPGTTILKILFVNIVSNVLGK